MNSGCVDCPHVIGDTYQRDCAFPDCVGGWENAYKGLADSYSDNAAEVNRLRAELEAVKAELEAEKVASNEFHLAYSRVRDELTEAKARIEEMRKPEKAPILFNNWQPVRDALDVAYKELGLEKIHEPNGSRFPSDHWNIAGLIYEQARRYYTKERGSCRNCGSSLSFDSAIRCLDCKSILCEFCAKIHFGKGHGSRAKLAHAPTLPEGWKAVPIEPTAEMINAGWIDKEDVNPDEIYSAMLEAAPEPK